MRTTALVAAALAVITVVAIRLVDDDASAPVDEAVSATADPTVAGQPATDPPYSELPPDDYEALSAMFEPALEELGLRLTRAGLADSPGSAEDPSLRGRHLAVYVEPLDADYGADEYVNSLITSARVFLPRVFEEWSDLASMDVCQEPPPGVDDRRAPAPYTVLEMSRAEAERIDWATVDVSGLLDAGDAGLVRLHVDEVVSGTRAFAEA